jgi:hypothetical protein
MAEPSEEAKWIRTDETLEAVLSLEMVVEQLAKIPNSQHYWKWAVVALHNSLQGFMVLSLQGTNNLNALTDECAKEWLLAYEQRSGLYPEPKLESFLGLYKRIKSERMLLHAIGKRFQPKGNQTNSVKKINELRNDFIHFVPKNWSLEISGLPAIFHDCISIIEFLAFECGNVVWYDEVLEKRTRVIIAQIKKQLVTLSLVSCPISE